MPRPEYGGYPIGEICAKPTPEGEVQKESGPRDGDLNGGLASVHPDCAARDREFVNSAAQSGK
jgi:hypothetical protein